MNIQKTRKYKRNKVFYSLTVGDIQTVALEIYGRELTNEEIDRIDNQIADNIPWFDLIDDAISEILDLLPSADSDK